MSTEPFFEKAAGDLVSAADVELAESQKRFSATYGDMIGGAASEKN